MPIDARSIREQKRIGWILANERPPLHSLAGYVRTGSPHPSAVNFWKALERRARHHAYILKLPRYTVEEPLDPYPST